MSLKKEQLRSEQADGEEAFTEDPMKLDEWNDDASFHSSKKGRTRKSWKVEEIVARDLHSQFQDWFSSS